MPQRSQQNDYVSLDQISKRGTQGKPDQPQKPRSKKKKKRGSVFLAFFLIVLILLSALVAWVALFLNDMDKRLDRQALDYNNLGISSKFDDKKYSGVTNIALFGLDRRKAKACRSDVVMIITVDNNTKTIKASSLLRDSAVTIDGRGTDKLNHAYAYGQAPLAIKTINQNFDLNIKDYIAVDFDAVAKLVDVIGPVTIDVQEKELKSLNSSVKEYCNLFDIKNPPYVDKAGVQELNGIQACAYSRVRKDGTGDDRWRTDRQRRVVEQLFVNMKKTNVFKLPGIAQELAPIVETSLDSKEAVKLAATVLLRKADFSEMRFPVDTDMKFQKVNGLSMAVFDKEVTIDKLHKYIFEDIKPQ